jgi:hypothetical protein
MIWTVLWVAWGLAFAGIEAAALHNDMPGDTLSEHLRKWFRTDTHTGRTVWAIASGIFFGWFAIHIAMPPGSIF